MLTRVTVHNIYELIEKHEISRGGVSNEDNISDSMFFYMAKYEYGVCILHEANGPIWIGLQNATARYSVDGKGGRFRNIEHAITTVMSRNFITVYYSDNAIERLRFIANQIEEWYNSGDILIVSAD